MQFDEKQFLKSALKMQAAIINRLHSENYENKQQAKTYKFGCVVLFAVCLISNVSWLNTFWGA